MGHELDINNHYRPHHRQGTYRLTLSLVSPNQFWVLVVGGQGWFGGGFVVGVGLWEIGQLGVGVKARWLNIETTFKERLMLGTKDWR
jgi:hypothetical protein